MSNVRFWEKQNRWMRFFYLKLLDPSLCHAWLTTLNTAKQSHLQPTIVLYFLNTTVFEVASKLSLSAVNALDCGEIIHKFGTVVEKTPLYAAAVCARRQFSSFDCFVNSESSARTPITSSIQHFIHKCLKRYGRFCLRRFLLCLQLDLRRASFINLFRRVKNNCSWGSGGESPEIYVLFSHLWDFSSSNKNSDLMFHFFSMNVLFRDGNWDILTYFFPLHGK